MSEPTDDPEFDDFLEKVGQESDPVTYFIAALKECGCEVKELPDGSFDIKKACPNLVTHSSNGFCEILCTKCYIALDIHPIDIPVVNIETDDDEDDIDAFLRVAGTEVNTDDYPKAKKSGIGSKLSDFFSDTRDTEKVSKNEDYEDGDPDDWP